MKKKQWYIIGVFILTIAIIVIGVVVNNEQKEASPSEPTTSVSKSNPVEKSHYENLANLQYEILKIEFNKETHQFLLDISTEEFLTNQQLKALEEEVFQNISKLVEKVDKTIIHVFNNKETYKSAVSNEYKGGFGLMETVVGNHQEKEADVQVTHYREIAENENGDVDAVAYDVVGSNDKDEEVTLDVVAKGNPKEISLFVKPFVTIIHDLNPDLKTVTLHIYNTAEDVKKKNIAYTYQKSILSYTESLTVKEETIQNEPAGESESAE